MNGLQNKLVKELEGLIRASLKTVPKDAVVALSGGIDSGLLAALGSSQMAVSVNLPYGEKYGELDYAKKVVNHLDLDHTIIFLDDSKFKETTKKAVRIIGEPIPHFNIFPLYVMYERLAKSGVKNVVLGDGPDESMCGYTRHLIINRLYNIYHSEAFSNYHPVIDKILPLGFKMYAEIAGLNDSEVEKIMSLENDLINSMCRVDMELKRPEMNTMSDKLAKHFGITNHRPYEQKEVDEFMFNLPPELKISPCGEYGKYLLRQLAENYLPKEIAWRKRKMGGPVYPVNIKMGWDKTEGEFEKGKWLEWQQKVLKSR